MWNWNPYLPKHEKKKDPLFMVSKFQRIECESGWTTFDIQGLPEEKKQSSVEFSMKWGTIFRSKDISLLL